MIVQRTPEWIDVRRGKPTASEMWRLMSDAGTVNTFKAEKLAERMCGQLPDRVSRDNPNIMRGIDLEDEAIRSYEAATGLLTTPGYWVDKISWGCTPDAFVEDDGLLQIKCPLPHNVIKSRYLVDEDWRKSEKKYYWQVMAEMAATDRQWADVGLYCKDFVDRDNWLWVKRIERDDDAVAELLEKIDEFCRSLDAVCRSAPRHEATSRETAPRDFAQRHEAAPRDFADDDVSRFLRG